MGELRVNANSEIKAPPRDAEVWNTALYKQFWSQKDRAPGAILFFRLGDFYELFGEDAILAAPELEVQLTSRDKKSETPIPMCGVPVHAWAGYAEKLLTRGYKVALCDQLSDPKDAKGKIVERGLVRILTPGLPVDFKHLPQKKKHFIAALSEISDGQVELLFHDFLSADFFSAKINSRAELNEFLKAFDPAELLVASGVNLRDSFWGLLNQSSFEITSYSDGDAQKLLKDYLCYTQCWSKQELESFWTEPKNLDLVQSKAALTHANLSQRVLEQWNVLPDLFDFFDHCGSVLGSRMLREILSRPLMGVERIENRQNIFSSITNPSKLLKISKDVNDVERLLGRFRVRAAMPRELIRFTQSLMAVHSLFQTQLADAKLWNDLFKNEDLPKVEDSLSLLADLLSSLERVLNLEVDSLRSKGLKDLIRPGADAEFDKLLEIFSGSQEWVHNYEQKLRDETGIPKLKVRYNRVFGYFIEVSKAHVSKVPSSFERKQTMVNAERYATDTLRDKESEILSAEVNIEKRAETLLENIQSVVLSNDQQLKRAFNCFAWIDAFCGISFGIASAERFAQWTTPKLYPGDFRFDIKQARHPLIEAKSESFVPNSISLGAKKSDPRILLLTGPNMAGKSTLMRQTGLCLLLAQCGFRVPAEEMSFAPASGFFSRMGASDKILDGESTFMVEMKETASILSESDENSFILIDEIGRGTSTQDGLAIAQAVLEQLHDASRAKVIFATHYHELSAVSDRLEESQNASMSIKEWEGDLIFLRSLEMQPAPSSHGIHVAKMAGLPATLLKRAEQLFDEANQSEAEAEAAPKPGKLKEEKKDTTSSKANDLQMSLFQAPLGVLVSDLSSLTGLKDIDVDDLSPRQAWMLLDKIQAELKAL